MTNICLIRYLLILSLGTDPCAVETAFLMHAHQEVCNYTSTHMSMWVCQRGQDESKRGSDLGQRVLGFTLQQWGGQGLGGPPDTSHPSPGYTTAVLGRFIVLSSINNQTLLVASVTAWLWKIWNLTWVLAIAATYSTCKCGPKELDQLSYIRISYQFWEVFSILQHFTGSLFL